MHGVVIGQGFGTTRDDVMRGLKQKGG